MGLLQLRRWPDPVVPAGGGSHSCPVVVTIYDWINLGDTGASTAAVAGPCSCLGRVRRQGHAALLPGFLCNGLPAEAFVLAQGETPEEQSLSGPAMDF